MPSASISFEDLKELCTEPREEKKIRDLISQEKCKLSDFQR